jgi:hypothetical protein
MEICEPFLTITNLSHLLMRDLSHSQLFKGETKVDVARAIKYRGIRLQRDHCRPVIYIRLWDDEARKIQDWLLQQHHLRILYPSFLDDATAAKDGVEGDCLYTTIYADETKVDKARQLLKAKMNGE